MEQRANHRDRGNQEGPGEATPAADRRTVAEWTTFAFSVVVTAALIGVALYEHFRSEEPAGIRLTVDVQADTAARRGEFYYVPFSVSNVGAEPATDVTVLFTVKLGETVLEESTADLAYLPVNGFAEGELVTAFDPATHDITGRVGTLQVP